MTKKAAVMKVTLKRKSRVYLLAQRNLYPVHSGANRASCETRETLRNSVLRTQRLSFAALKYTDLCCRVASIDGTGVDNVPIADLDAVLHSRIDQILDRKRSSGQGREGDLAAYVYILRYRYLPDTVSQRFEDLMGAFLRSIRSETSAKEVVLALKAIQVTVMTDTSEASYDMCAKQLKGTISDSQFPMAKAEAIYTLGVVTFFGGASTTTTSEVMDYLLEIISSDGASVEAEDDPKVVAAALEVWGFLATQIEDLEEESEAAADAMSDQLESTYINVQVCAGNNIALLYEKSWTSAESDEDLSDIDESSGGGHGVVHDTAKVKRYEPYRNKVRLLDQLEELSAISAKRLSKKDRKLLHSNFADIKHSVENPTLGPRYSTALAGPDSDEVLGSRLKVAIDKKSKTTMVVNRWWKLHRLTALKRILQNGFLEHYEHNPVVLEALPILTN